jgi:hypothetical protein
MKKIIRILFPFYSSEKHGFLFGKLWFKIFLLLLPILYIQLCVRVTDLSTHELFGWCYEDLQYRRNSDIRIFAIDPDLTREDAENMKREWDLELERCKELADRYDMPAGLISISSIIALHYLGQFIFFKIVPRRKM